MGEDRDLVYSDKDLVQFLSEMGICSTDTLLVYLKLSALAIFPVKEHGVF